MAREFLGRGWSFPVRLDGNGQIAASPVESPEDKVRQSVEIILRTAPGERMMRPDFGCGIHNLVFDSINDDLLSQVLSQVSDALTRWEPRIELLGVDARQDSDTPNRLLIEIDYLVRTTNSRFNLVFPFYVQ
jgi:phage baseplate assembly protein W